MSASPALALPCLLHAQLVNSHPDSLVGLNAEHMFASRASRLAPACIACMLQFRGVVSADERGTKEEIRCWLVGLVDKGFWSEPVYVRWYIGRQMGQKSCLSRWYDCM
jgi:hypothetical protein